MTNAIPVPRRDGKFILVCFLAFFVVVSAVDAGFVYTAIHTSSGEVTQQAYEKGLAYNHMLEEANAQPTLKEGFTYDRGVAIWSAAEADGRPLDNALVKVKFIRPVSDGYDFETVLQGQGNGIYKASPHFPAKGLWIAQVSATWNEKQYRTIQQFIVP